MDNSGSLAHPQAPMFNPAMAAVPAPAPIMIVNPNAPPLMNEPQNLEDLIYNAEITDQVIEVGDKGLTTAEKDKYDQLGSVLVTKEEVPPGTNRRFATNLHESFRICQRFLAVLSRVPIGSYQKDDTEVIFEFRWTTFRGYAFFTSSILFALILLLTSINILCTMINFPTQPNNFTVDWDKFVDPLTAKVDWEPLFSTLAYPKRPKVISGQRFNNTKNKVLLRAEEMFLFRRNLAPSLMILCCLVHITISDLKLFRRREFVATYLSYWAESVEIMKIDAAGDVGRYCNNFLFYYVFWIFLFVGVNAINLAPVSSGSPVAFAILWFRCFYPPAYALPDGFILGFRIAGSIFYAYIMLCSKAYVFFFLFVCRILRTSCIVWNERLESVFTIEERKKTRAEKCTSRTGYDHLFRDYVNILDLMNGANTLFTNILESYFSVSLATIVFEVYYLVRPILSGQEEFTKARVLDMSVVAVVLFNSIMVFYLVTVAAAEVSVAAADGLEIIRRQGIMGHRSDEEMHFMISVYMSFTGHFDSSLIGGGYFVLNKQFLIAIAGALISYIIIIFQFQPTLGVDDKDQTVLVGINSENPKDVANYRALVFHLENTWYYFKEQEPGY